MFPFLACFAVRLVSIAFHIYVYYFFKNILLISFELCVLVCSFPFSCCLVRGLVERGAPGTLEGAQLTFIAFPFCYTVTRDFRGRRSDPLRTLLQHRVQKFVGHSLERRKHREIFKRRV